MLRIISLSIFAFLLLLQGRAQSINHVDINWSGPTAILDSLGKLKNVLNFGGASHDSKNGYLPVFSQRIDGNVTEFSILNPIYASLSVAEQKLLAGHPEISQKTTIEVGHQYGKPISFISFIPLKYNNGIPEKLISFDFSYTTENTPSIHRLSRTSSIATSSMLSSGIWHKISIQSSGVFKIDYSFLQNMGINPASIDPRQIRILGNGGGMLPQANSIARIDDLAEDSILVFGEADGVFDAGDYILFYGKGPDTWTYNSGSKIFTQNKNLYSDKAYYFLTIGPGNGKRIGTQGDAGPQDQVLTSFDDRFFHESDNENIIVSGREWYGEIFSGNEDMIFDQFIGISNISSGSTLKLTTKFMAYA
ncbi:MAG: hypothetical protein ACJ75J_08725, partial [Cytophagaceae bacterium]